MSSFKNAYQLENWLNHNGIKFGCILGNNDWEAVVPLFREMESESVFFLHDEFWRLSKDILIWGYPFIPPTPFPPKDFE